MTTETMIILAFAMIYLAMGFWTFAYSTRTFKPAKSKLVPARVRLSRPKR